MDIAAKEKARLKGSQIVGVAPGVHVYVEVRCWDNNGELYDGLDIQNAYDTVHVVECAYTNWRGCGIYFIMVTCMLCNEEWSWDAYDVFCWGTCREVKEGMTLVDEHDARLYPEMLPGATEFAPDRRTNILTRLGAAV